MADECVVRAVDCAGSLDALLERCAAWAEGADDAEIQAGALRAIGNIARSGARCEAVVRCRAAMSGLKAACAASDAAVLHAAVAALRNVCVASMHTA
jgi:hypothetical protein